MNDNITELKKEKKYLDYAKAQIADLIKTEEIRFKNLPKQYKADPFLLQRLMTLVGVKLNNLNTSEKKPYFARIDFKNDKEKNVETCYIGKVGVISNDSQIVVVDWRAPISSIYYDGNIGRVSYNAPDGKIQGDLSLKRQIVIENGQLLSIFDVDSVSDDELLKPYLGVNADSRLKNIVSSIQSEQNNIIRENLDKNIIIQGVAGSGKTTVALHRISYLIYNLNDVSKQDRFMVIGPNKFFINYISNVLPDLDVANAKQWTFEEFAKEYVNENIKIIDMYQTNMKDNTNLEEDNIYKFKTSMRYKEILDKYIQKFEDSMFENDGIYINEYRILTSKQIKKIYYDNNVLDICIKKKIDRTCEIITKKVHEKENVLKEKIRDVFDRKILFATSEIEREELKKCKFDIYKELNNGCKKVLKKYFEKGNIKIIQMYKQFIEQIDKSDTNIDIEKYRQNILSNINKKTFEVEDIPAIMYLKYKLNGADDYKKYLHAVIDEAQDFGEFHFYVLRKIMQNSTFSIFGDLAQSIYSFRAIDNWDYIINDIFETKCELMKLKKSYRTSIEIMNEANKVNTYLGLDKAMPVIRHGQEVKTVKIAGNKEKVEYIENKINEYIQKGYKSIAIICKDEKSAKHIYSNIKDKIKDIELISQDNEMYNGGICVLTAFLAKGLEFDADIILDVDENVYNSNYKYDMKLLYVAMTRALHEMELTYENYITKPLK